MAWSRAHKCVLTLPLVIAIYLLGIVLIANSSEDSSGVSNFTEFQADEIARYFSSVPGLFIIMIGLSIWYSMIWLTFTIARRSQDKTAAARQLGEHARICAENIVRYAVFRRQRDNFAIKLAGITDEDLSLFSASDSLMSEYEILWSSQVLAIFREAEAYGITLDDDDAALLKHPKDPEEVETVAEKLGILNRKLAAI